VAPRASRRERVRELAREFGLELARARCELGRERMLLGSLGKEKSPASRQNILDRFISATDRKPLSSPSGINALSVRVRPVITFLERFGWIANYAYCIVALVSNAYGKR
jgi:hypothetical protein